VIHGSHCDVCSPTATLRRAPVFLKATAVTLVFAFLGLTLQPLAIAANLPDRKTFTTPPPSDSEKLSQHLERIETHLEKLHSKLLKRADASKEAAELKTHRSELETLDQKAIEDFDRIEKHLKEKHLPPVILQRHAEAVKHYRSEMAALKGNLDGIDSARDDNDRRLKTQKAKDHLKEKQKKRTQQKFDPNNLPNRSLKADPKNKPKLRKGDFIRAGLYDQPAVQLAALGDFRFDQLTGASDPSYLAATTEVTLTPAIRAKALELEYQPVKIYNWVRNNVEWIPTWGAQQDADVTLGSQRGNAMDIASLLIALYRASGIPARYVHGTIEVPADKFMNWAGGFTSITAAADYAASGGVPVTTITSGGQITKVQLEHIWVEAAIDYVPSWGAVNKSADTWVPLDATFKQYQDLPGLDVVTIAGIDTNALAQSFAASGTTNQQEGWVSGLNPAILQNAQTQAQTALTNYINTNLPNATVGDVIGGRKIIALNSQVFTTVLPNRAVVIGARYGTLPAALQNAMTLAFGTDPIGELINPVTFPWARLNNHKVTLSFKPATAADEQTLASLLPPGPITDPSQLLGSIPAYLITVIPEIAVDGQVVGQSNAMRLGEDLNFYYGISRVGGIGNQTYTYAVAAGSYESVMVGGGSVSSVMLQNLRSKITQTQTALKLGSAAAIGALTREDVLGDIFYAGTLSYFGQYIDFARFAAVPQKSRHNLPLGYGTFGYEPKVQTLFGLPRAITPGSIAVNVRLGWAIRSLDSDTTKQPSLSLETGLLSSALEHSVPEQLFSTPQQSVQGISAVKAIQIASGLGQRIYHLTPANQAQTLPHLHLDSQAMTEITQALAVGKEAIVHTDRITVSGWTGEGYILFDSATGDGAYKITGGTNGSSTQVQDLFQKLLSYLAAFLGLIKESAGNIADFLNTAISVIDALWNCPSPHAQFIAGLAVTFFIVGLGMSFIFGAVLGVVAGVLASFLFAAGVDAWLSQYKDARCSG